MDALMASDTARQDAEEQSKAKIFISYSRADLGFADGLGAALKARGFLPLMDRRDIAKFEDWWKRIETLIVQTLWIHPSFALTRSPRRRERAARPAPQGRVP